ncbi:MAG: LysR family transcriptional regulator [Bdellovibrionales bacterium]|nr:LysR family transcriptional regulator [Bdellovibrionales bacterium]
MLLDQINLNYLRIFESVYRTRSMTQAAQELHLTQSGISQHIKSLEDSLEVKLFDRIKQKLIPTAEGRKLYDDISPQLKGLESALLSVTAKDHLLRGEVNIGVPEVFGLNMIIPKLVQFANMHPEVRFNLHFDLAHSLNGLLLNGVVDFAFVDDFTMDSQIKTQKVYDEVLKMCCSQEYFKALVKKGHTEGSKDFYENCQYISYEKGEPILRRWLQQHVRGGQYNLNVRAYVADALGISRFIINGLGLGVLPGHHADKLIEQGYKLHIFDTKGKESKNTISMAAVGNRSHSAAVQSAIDFLTQSFQK